MARHYGPLEWEDEQQEARSRILTMRLVLEGKVQGVGFRQWFKKSATELKLDGWVRNRNNETLEVLIKGPETVVRELMAKSYQGPPAAYVKRVKEFPENGLREIPKGFVILHTS